MANYGNHRKYRVNGVDLTLSPMSKFPSPKYKTYFDYFTKIYKVPPKGINKN